MKLAFYFKPKGWININASYTVHVRETSNENEGNDCSRWISLIFRTISLHHFYRKQKRATNASLNFDIRVWRVNLVGNTILHASAGSDIVVSHFWQEFIQIEITLCAFGILWPSSGVYFLSWQQGNLECFTLKWIPKVEALYRTPKKVRWWKKQCPLVASYSISNNRDWGPAKSQRTCWKTRIFNTKLLFPNFFLKGWNKMVHCM